MLRFYMNGGVTRANSRIYRDRGTGEASVEEGEIVIRILTDMHPSQVVDKALEACGFKPTIQTDDTSWTWNKERLDGSTSSVEVIQGTLYDPSNMPCILLYVPNADAHALTLELDWHIIGGYMDTDEPDIELPDGSTVPNPRSYSPGIQTHGKYIEGRFSDAYLNLVGRENGPDIPDRR